MHNLYQNFYPRYKQYSSYSINVFYIKYQDSTYKIFQMRILINHNTLRDCGLHYNLLKYYKSRQKYF